VFVVTSTPVQSLSAEQAAPMPAPAFTPQTPMLQVSPEGQLEQDAPALPQLVDV
jgi:hypothetical protein